MKTYDTIVIGVGGVGSAAMCHLARRGLRVLGIDRFPLGHDRGSSHGKSRIFRTAYYLHPDYVPLACRAYDLWQALAERSGKDLYHETGILECGPPDGLVVPGVLEAARRHDLDVEPLTPSEARDRFPGLHVPHDFAAVFESRAGWLHVERCVETHANEALGHGAEIQFGEVRGWRAERQGVVVETDAGLVAAGGLVVAAGAWAGTMLRQLNVPLEVWRKPLFWYDAPDRRCHEQHGHERHGMPCFLYETPDGVFYGFPACDDTGLKVAEHSGGTVVTDPLAPDRNVRDADQRRIETFLGQYLPHVSSRRADHAVCMYTMTPDEHFVVDRHPDLANVVIAAGLSGHGFKFASALGEALAELIVDRRSRVSLNTWRIDRPALRP